MGLQGWWVSHFADMRCSGAFKGWWVSRLADMRRSGASRQRSSVVLIVLHRHVCGANLGAGFYLRWGGDTDGTSNFEGEVGTFVGRC